MHPQIDQVKVVIRSEDLNLYKQAVKAKNILPPAHGGPERQDSVRLGLNSIAELDPEIVLIHDACRPLISERVISEIIEALKYCQGAIAATAATDTIKMADITNNTIIKTIDRKLIFHAQTPQGFRFKEIFRLHKLAASKHFTDDAAIFEAYGKPVKIIPSPRSNIKITMPEDITEDTNNNYTEV
jgi:2-C-methyl-D-erythritol 4-phosphate cytidylyltransferase/2-C-methyl-D-erythritol 2,4-cyclodiphosphate synthase